MADDAAAVPDRRETNSLSPTAHMPEFSDNEKRSIADQSRPSAALIHETIRAEGQSELERTASALILSGFAAGLSMGFSLMVQGVLHDHLPDTPWRELVTGLGYTIGFLIVVLGRQQLFTENTLTPILPLLHHRDAGTLGRVARLWALVLVSNIAATWVFAALAAHTPVFDAELKAAFADIAQHATGSPFWTTFLKAVFAGWLIALMVWLLPAAEAARPLIIVIIAYVVAIGQFSHLIAGSIDAFYLVEVGRAGWSDYALRFFVPTFLGNVVGGVALVAVLNYGQVAHEIGSESPKRSS
jgi:formate/nitrite transporter FocA (FNT family)